MGVDLFEGFYEFGCNTCHFHDCPDETMSNRRKGSDEVEKDSRSIGGARDGELMHESVNHENIVHHESSGDAFLCRVNSFINNFTESEFKAGTSDFNEGVGEVERTEIEGCIDFKARGGGEEGFLGEKNEEGEEELWVEFLFREAEEREESKDKGNGD